MIKNGSVDRFSGSMKLMLFLRVSIKITFQIMYKKRMINYLTSMGGIIYLLEKCGTAIDLNLRCIHYPPSFETRTLKRPQNTGYTSIQTHKCVKH